MRTPRSETVLEKPTLAESSCNSVTVSLSSCCLLRTNSCVLSAFILSPLLLIHSSVRSTQEMKRCSGWCGCCRGTDLQLRVISIWVCGRPALAMMLNNSALYSRNSNFWLFFQLFQLLQWLMMAIRRCCGVFVVISAPWYKYTNLLTFFRLIPTSMTLNDLEQRNSPYFAFFTEFDCFAGQ